MRDSYWCTRVRKLRMSDWSVWACVCLYTCGCAGSFQRAKKYTNENVHPLIHGLTVCPSFLKAASECVCACVCVCVCVCMCVCVFVREGDQARRDRSEKESSNNLATNICIPQSTGVLFFALLYLPRDRAEGKKSSKHLKKMCICVCLCIVTFGLSSKHS